MWEAVMVYIALILVVAGYTLSTTHEDDE